MPRVAWELHRELDPSSETPLFVQLVTAIAADIAAGKLVAGQRLPGSRTLARSLGVHRNTVLAAYAELASEGWIIARPAQATIVAPTPPSRLGASRKQPRDAGFDLAPVDTSGHQPTHPPGTLVLSRATPDIRLLPVAALAAAYRRVLTRHGASLLYYGDPQGHPRLRAALSTMLGETRGIVATPGTVLVTRGSQMAVAITARTLLAPGDVVAVEALGHPLVWAALRSAGAQLEPVPIDRGGLDVEALAKLVARKRVRAVYVTPHHQFPTNVVMPAERRRALLALARAHRIAIIEDDYDHEFHYEARPIAPIASADEAGVVIYLGTLSKILAPGLRLGFVVAPPVVVERMVSIRAAIDLQGDHATECAVAELFEDGEIQRHVRRMRQVYRDRRDALAHALRRELASVLSFEVPAGGMALWASVRDGVDLEAWAAAGGELGVAFRSARFYDIAGRDLPFARLSFTALTEAELVEAVRRMTRALTGGRARPRASTRS